MPDRVYLDWNATTPLRPEARQAVADACDLNGNPSSVHTEGRKARRLVEEARAAVAEAVGGRPQDVIFSSGGTEANALALTPGLRRGAGQPVQRLLVSAIEHTSVLAGGLLHVDAIQALGKIPFDIKSIGADIVTLSAHKVGGPKGAGAVVLAGDVQGLEPLLRGGGQELGRRAGTENVAGISAFGAATKAAMAALDGDTARLRNLKDRLEEGLKQTPGMIVFSEDAPRLPNTTLFTVPGLRAETAVIGFDLAGIAVSSGSACSSGKVQPSHVLEAMGTGRELAQGAVRLSTGWSTSEADIDLALKAWRKLADALLRGERRNTA